VAAAVEPPPPPTFKADPAAGDELKAQMTKMLAAIDSGDVDTAVSTMAPESEELPSFTLDPEGKAIKSANLEDAKNRTKEAMGEMKKTGAKLKTDVKSIHCQAASTLGICALEIERNVQFPDGKQVAMSGRVTAAARKGSDGWRWTHWHLSYAKEPESTAAPSDATSEAASMDQRDLKWQDVPGVKGAQIATVWTNPKTKASANFIKAPKGFNVPRHYHSAPIQMVLLEGDLTITEEGGGKVHELKAGSWGLEPAKTIHTTTSKKGALAFMISLAPFDQVMVDEKGLPLPPKDTKKK